VDVLAYARGASVIAAQTLYPNGFARFRRGHILLIDGAPEIAFLAIDGDHHLVEMRMRRV
jgi:hypothetical protein